MNGKQFFKVRLYFTGFVAIAMWSLLGWNHYHGGVPSHHLLADETLPEVSNWWGALLLPSLTWFLMYRIQVSVFGSSSGNMHASRPLVQEYIGFLAALLFGILLSAFFSLGYPDLSGFMILGLFPLALFYPIYRAECLLGFVIGMTYTFGAVLPTGIGTFLALLGLLLYVVVRGGFLFVRSKFALMAMVRKQRPMA